MSCSVVVAAPTAPPGPSTVKHCGNLPTVALSHACTSISHSVVCSGACQGVPKSQGDVGLQHWHGGHSDALERCVCVCVRACVCVRVRVSSTSSSSSGGGSGGVCVCGKSGGRRERQRGA